MRRIRPRLQQPSAVSAPLNIHVARLGSTGSPTQSISCQSITDAERFLSDILGVHCGVTVFEGGYRLSMAHHWHALRHMVNTSDCKARRKMPKYARVSSLIELECACCGKPLEAGAGKHARAHVALLSPDKRAAVLCCAWTCHACNHGAVNMRLRQSQKTLVMLWKQTPAGSVP